VSKKPGDRRAKLKRVYYRYRPGLDLKQGEFYRKGAVFMEQPPSTAAQVIISLIPIVGIVMGSVVVFFYLLWNHRQKMLLIKTGNYSRPDFDLLSFSLLTGLLLTSVGISLTVFLGLVRGFSYVLLGGVIPLSIGVGLLIYFGMNRRGRPV
jgi:hypothetical protein